MSAPTRAWTVTLTIALAACSADPIPERPIPALDADAYASRVHPVLRVSCASLDCHGDPGRPLRLYAEDGLRAQDALRGQPITVEETRWNAVAIAGVDPEASTPDLHLALTKPLAVAAGGLAHAGGDVWPDREDPGYRCLRAWLAGESERTESIAACSEAAAAVDPYPPDAGP